MSTAGCAASGAAASPVSPHRLQTFCLFLVGRLQNLQWKWWLRFLDGIRLKGWQWKHTSKCRQILEGSQGKSSRGISITQPGRV